MNQTAAKPIRVVCYCRVATKTQDDDLTMDAQVRVLREQARQLGAEVIGEVCAYEKGLTLNRPGWNRAIQLAVTQNADAIVVKNADRIVRGTPLLLKAYATMEKRGISLYTCDGAFPSLRPILTIS